MKVQGCDCLIVIKTTYKELNVPYSEETIREAFSVLYEEASIEGDGTCRAIRKKCGVTGCVVTPLTIGTAPLLLFIAMGAVQEKNEERKKKNEEFDMSEGGRYEEFVSGSRDLYRYQLNLLPMEDSVFFDLIQDRQKQMSNEKLAMSNERRLFEGCRVSGFELRIEREQAVKLKLDIYSDRPAVTYPYQDVFSVETGERFSGDCVTYKINGQEYKNIYGLTLISKKQGGSKTEIWIKRSLEIGDDIPEIIEEIVITAQLLRDKYEYRYYGTFRITLRELVLISDETNVNSTDAVMGLLRYYVSGGVKADVFASGGERL